MKRRTFVKVTIAAASVTVLPAFAWKPRARPRPPIPTFLYEMDEQTIRERLVNYRELGRVDLMPPQTDEVHISLDGGHTWTPMGE